MDQIMIGIMLHLVGGAAVREDIYEEIQPMNRRTFDRKVKKLVENKFVKSRNYLNFDKKRYVGDELRVLILKPQGADFLCSQFHTLRREWIRTAEPALKHLMHDLYVRKIIRKIVRDDKAGLFKLTNIKDEAYVKQEYKIKKQSLKGRYLADIQVYTLKDGNSKVTLVEVDNGSKALSYWVAKIGQWCDMESKPDIVIVAPNPNRLKVIFDALKNSNVRGRISLKPFDLFMTEGLAVNLSEFENNPGHWFYNHALKEKHHC